ncbi:MAG: cyclic pyranopterin monophosphate synthase MoaC [Streptococcaceae bacterium]|nr:cyclic pyranopterin monophosphate synthase MoaC [Streptococcaceae bacterium]
MAGKLTHINAQGRAKMVDVSEKMPTNRVAKATSTLVMQPETLARIKSGGIEKGDVLAVAQTAGIMAAKRTSELIPMCHLLALTGIDIIFVDNGVDTLTLTATVKTRERTGVEMEALCAVQVAALTVYDMCKAIDRSMTLTECHVLEKSGGKSGTFVYGAD